MGSLAPMRLSVDRESVGGMRDNSRSPWQSPRTAGEGRTHSRIFRLTLVHGPNQTANHPRPRRMCRYTRVVTLVRGAAPLALGSRLLTRDPAVEGGRLAGKSREQYPALPDLVPRLAPGQQSGTAGPFRRQGAGGVERPPKRTRNGQRDRVGEPAMASISRASARRDRRARYPSGCCRCVRSSRPACRRAS